MASHAKTHEVLEEFYEFIYIVNSDIGVTHILIRTGTILFFIKKNHYRLFKIDI